MNKTIQRRIAEWVVGHYAPNERRYYCWGKVFLIKLETNDLVSVECRCSCDQEDLSLTCMGYIAPVRQNTPNLYLN